MGQPRKRQNTTRTIVASTLLLLLPRGSAQACERVASTLATTCGGLCLQYEPCLVTSACPSGVACKILANQCAVQCDAKSAADPRAFTFFVPFGSSTSQQEHERAPSKTLLVDKPSRTGPEDATTFAAASNHVVTKIATMELQPSVTSFVLVGGNSVNRSVKRQVANVTFASDIISTHASVTTIVLQNVDLSQDATLQDLPVVLPPSVQTLSLTNTLLSAFPTIVANFTHLQTLNVDQNDIADVAATAALNSLVHLNVASNDLTSFRAVFPNLITLNLRHNKLREIPASLFIHDRLRQLHLKGNPLVAPWFTHAQTAFLTALTSLDLDNTDFIQRIDSCHTANQRHVHALIVCVSDNPVKDDVRSVSTSDIVTIVRAVTAGVLLLLCLIGLGLCLYRSRVRHHARHHAHAVRQSYFGGLAPPLTRSPALKGYRGGRRTPVSGGPRVGPAYDDDGDDDALHASSLRLSTQSTQSSTAYSLWHDDELLSLQVQVDDIEDVGTISSGAFGVVWLVKYRKSQLLASKRLRADPSTKHRAQAFIEEIKMAACLNHPNIVRLIGCAWTIESDLQALFEYMENGDLRDYLIDPTSPRHWSHDVMQVAVDILDALVYVHSFTPPLVHRDLKSRNVLLTASLTAKVTDFGASRYKSVDDTMTAAVGTGRWLAPEVIQGSTTYDQSVDIYAFGIVLSELDTHAIPYDQVRGPHGNRLNDIAILQLVATGDLRPRFGSTCPRELRLLADRCLDQDPANRPPAHVVAYELRVIQRSLYTLL